MRLNDAWEIALHNRKFPPLVGQMTGRWPSRKRVAICGPGCSGKDVAAEYLARTRALVYWGSTSRVIVPAVAAKLGLSEDETYARRHEFRPLMFETGIELRRQDPAYLARTVLEHGNLCVGVRDRAEMQAVRAERLVDVAIWIERPGLHDPTMQYGPELCDFIVPNRWGLDEFYQRIDTIANLMNL